MILIDMELPNSCSECRFETEAGYCKAMESGFCGNTTEEERPEWCPLKGQEAVEPVLMREGRNEYYNDYVCPECDNELVFGQNFCSECGRQVKWDGRT